MTAHELLDEVNRVGWKVVVSPAGKPGLVKRHPEMDPLPGELLALLMDRRQEVLEALCGCESCGRAVCAEDAAVLAGVNPLCGEVGCPYRRGERR